MKAKLRSKFQKESWNKGNRQTWLDDTNAGSKQVLGDMSTTELESKEMMHRISHLSLALVTRSWQGQAQNNAILFGIRRQSGKKTALWDL